VIARKRGWCPYCQTPWWPGEHVSYAGKALMHGYCLRDYWRALEALRGDA